MSTGYTKSFAEKYKKNVLQIDDKQHDKF